MLPVALEVQHRVHHMLQNARARQTAFLGHVTHDEGGRAGLLGVANDGSGALAHLADAARRAGAVLGHHGLNTVDDEHVRLHSLAFFQNALHIVFRQHIQLVLRDADAAGAHLDLPRAFLTADVQHPAALAQTARHLQQQRAFADARVAAQQNGAAGDQTAAQHPVQFFVAGGGAGLLPVFYLAEGHDLAFAGRLVFGGFFGGFAGSRSRGAAALLESVPFSAVRAAAQPTGGFVAAGLTDVDGFLLGQRELLFRRPHLCGLTLS